MVIVGTLWEDETRFFFLRDWAISNDCASIIVRLRLQGVLNGDLRGSDDQANRYFKTFLALQKNRDCKTAL